MLPAMEGAPRQLDRALLRRHLRIWLTVSAIFALTVAGTAYAAWWVLARTKLDPFFLDKLSLILRANAIVLILVTLFMGLYTVLLSQHIAAPSARVQDALREAQARRFDLKVELEPHDYLHGVARDTNQLMLQLASDQRALQRLSSDLNALAQRAASEASDDLAQPLAKLAARARRLAGVVVGGDPHEGEPEIQPEPDAETHAPEARGEEPQQS